MKVSCIIWDDRIAVVIVGVDHERPVERVKVLIAAALANSGRTTPADFEESFDAKCKLIETRSFFYGTHADRELIYGDEGSAEKDGAKNIEECVMFALPYTTDVRGA